MTRTPFAGCGPAASKRCWADGHAGRAAMLLAMRSALPLVVLVVLAGCDPAASKPKRPAFTSKARPPASLPMPSRPEPAAPAWLAVSVHDGDTLRAIGGRRSGRCTRFPRIDKQVAQATYALLRPTLAWTRVAFLANFANHPYALHSLKESVCPPQLAIQSHWLS